jgi:hypothetical protein
MSANSNGPKGKSEVLDSNFHKKEEISADIC